MQVINSVICLEISKG